jgi:hypothetical protein
MIFDLALFWVAEIIGWLFGGDFVMPQGLIDGSYDAVGTARSFAAKFSALGPLMPSGIMAGALKMIVVILAAAVWFRLALWSYQRITNLVGALR